MKAKISARAQIDVDSPNARTPELRVDNYTPKGFSVEDYVIVKGKPVHVEQRVHSDAVVSCEGIMYTADTDFEDIASDAVVRFSAARNLEVSRWYPYVDNTWGNPYIALSKPLTQTTTRWLNGRVLQQCAMVTTTDDIALTNYSNDATMVIMFALSPTEEASSIVFDDLVINVQDGLVEIHTPTVSTSRAASIGNTPTILAVAFNNGTCDIYVKPGFEPVSKVTLSANTTGEVAITGRLGILAIDIWDGHLFVPAKLDEMLRVIAQRVEI